SVVPPTRAPGLSCRRWAARLALDDVAVDPPQAAIVVATRPTVPAVLPRREAYQRYLRRVAPSFIPRSFCLNRLSHVTWVRPSSDTPLLRPPGYGRCHRPSRRGSSARRRAATAPLSASQAADGLRRPQDFIAHLLPPRDPLGDT